MTPALVVRFGGFHTTVQDLGRHGYQELGVPVAGALDPVALALANALVGNPPGTAGLEICVLGPSLEVAAESVRVAVCGFARMTLKRGGESRPLDGDRSHLLVTGDVLSVGALAGAGVAVLAVGGGFALDPVMGSLATYVRAGIGPLGGKPLIEGTRLPLRQDRAMAAPDMALAAPFDYGAGPIRVMAGPQAEAFTPSAWATFLGAEYQVGRDADRMGLRLDGPALAHRGAAGIASEGLVSGAIQVPGNGQPIILLADHQTVGGYAKIATVISADLPRLGRALPGTLLRFKAVDMGEAEAARLALARAVAAAVAGMAEPAGGLDLDALYGANLVSGMVSGAEDERP